MARAVVASGARRSPTGPRTAAAVGGLSCALALGTIAVTLPALTRYKNTRS